MNDSFLSVTDSKLYWGRWDINIGRPIKGVCQLLQSSLNLCQLLELFWSVDTSLDHSDKLREGNDESNWKHSFIQRVVLEVHFEDYGFYLSDYYIWDLILY